MTLKEMIISLCSIPGPSGFEDKAADACIKMLTPYADTIETDSMGNVFAWRRCGRADAKLLMLTAHLDEIGLIVTGYEGGFLRFDALGGVDGRMLPASDVTILTEPPIKGVIGTAPVHVLSAQEQNKPIPIKKLFIDTGLSPEETRARIPLGTPAVISGGAHALGQDKICGKSLDDRACAAVLIKVMEELSDIQLDVDICLMLAVQEELGYRGATTGTFRVQPDYCIAADVTHGCTPDGNKAGTFPLGKGVAVGAGPNMHRGFTSLIKSTADDEGIPYSIEVLSRSSGTDAWAVQISRTGVITGLVSLPLRYMHTPVEVISMSDADALLKLLRLLAVKVGSGEETYHA